MDIGYISINIFLSSPFLLLMSANVKRMYGCSRFYDSAIWLTIQLIFLCHGARSHIHTQTPEERYIERAIYFLCQFDRNTVTGWGLDPFQIFAPFFFFLFHLSRIFGISKCYCPLVQLSVCVYGTHPDILVLYNIMLQCWPTEGIAIIQTKQ